MIATIGLVTAMFSESGGPNPVTVPLLLFAVATLTCQAGAAYFAKHGGADRLGRVALWSLLPGAVVLIAAFPVGRILDDPGVNGTVMIASLIFILLAAINPVPWMAVGWAWQVHLGNPPAGGWWGVIQTTVFGVLVAIGLGFGVAILVTLTQSGIDWAVFQGDPSSGAQVAGGILGGIAGICLGVAAGLFLFCISFIYSPVIALFAVVPAWALTRTYGPQGWVRHPQPGEPSFEADLPA